MPWNTNCHKEQRWKFLQQYSHRKKPLAELCRQWHISRKTAYKWIARFNTRGRFGLADRRRVARRVHNRPTKLWLQRIRRWRAKHPSWGAPKIRWALCRRFGRRDLPSEAGISRWLKRWRLTRRPRRAPHKGPVINRPKLTPAKAPNDVWTVDFKGWFRTGDGTRVEPLTIRDLASRFVLGIRLLRRQTLEDCRLAMEQVFAQYGLPKVIRTDNGAPFGAAGALGLTRLSAWWVKLGIRVEFTEPGHPEQNGAHEQLHRVFQEETVNPAAPSFRAQKVRSAKWCRQYNQQRPHEALAMKRPIEVYSLSRRRLPRRRQPWRYAAGMESRLVKGKGMISFQGRSRFVGEAFERERVGLRRVKIGVWEVYFGPLLIGELWDQDATPGIRAVWYRKGRRGLPTRTALPSSASARYAHLRSAGKRSVVLPMR